MENEVQQVIPSVKPLLQNQTLTPTPPLTNWSKILLFTFLGFVVIAGSVLVGIQIGKNQITKQLAITPIQTVVSPTALPRTFDPTADWKTYTTYYYSFKYPNNWITENLGELGPEKIIELTSINLSNKGYGPHAITIAFTGDSAEDQIRTRKIQNQSDFTVDGIKGTRFSEIWADDSKHTTIIVPHKNYSSQAVIFSTDNNYEVVFDQILPTFKFSN